MNHLKTVNIIIIAAVLALAGFTVYSLLPKSTDEPADPQATLLEFKILKTDLEQWEIDQYVKEFAGVKAALENDPENSQALLQLGQLKQYAGDYAGAEAAWIRAGEVRPRNSTSFGNLAGLYVNFMHAYAKAEAAYRVAIANSQGEEKNAYFYRNFYSLYQDHLKDDQKAEATLLQGIADNPKSSDLHILLGIFYRERGQPDQAILHYEQGIALSPVENRAAEQELAELKRQR